MFWVARISASLRLLQNWLDFAPETPLLVGSSYCLLFSLLMEDLISELNRSDESIISIFDRIYLDEFRIFQKFSHDRSPTPTANLNLSFTDFTRDL